MRARLTSLGIGLLLLAFSACTHFGVEPSLLVSTDRNSYQMVDGAATVKVSMQNGGDQSIALTGCPDPPSVIVEHVVDGDWEQLFSVGVVCVANLTSRTVNIEPGDLVNYKFRVGAAGKYRVRVPVGADWSMPYVIVDSMPFIVE